MNAGSTVKGRKGEDIAIEFLQSKGMAIIERNWRSAPYEIDIIARDKDMLVIVEVKMRHSDVFGPPQMSVNTEKQRNMMRCANRYVLQKNIEQDVRFDIVTILTNNTGFTINHIPNAFSIY